MTDEYTQPNSNIFPDIFEQPGASTEIWYWKPEHSLEALSLNNNLFAEAVKRGDLSDTHVHLGNISETDLETIFVKMQGEMWSPNGEARSLISEKGLNHTSMSMGDVVVTPDNKIHMVKMSGFETID